MKLSKVKIVLLFLVLFFLDWTALQDVFTGKQLPHLSEYALLGISIAIVGYVLYKVVKKDE